MPTTWSASDKDAGVTLSNTNHTATVTTLSTDQGVRGTSSHASGKWYLEYSNIVLGGFHSKYGFATAGATLHPVNSALTFGMGEAGAYDQGGGNLGSPVGHTLQMCIDISAGKYWLRYDGSGGWFGVAGSVGASTDPTNGINGADYTSIVAAGVGLLPFLDGFSNSGQLVSAKINAGDSAFVSAPPSGFTAWDNIPPFTQSYGSVIS